MRLRWVREYSCAHRQALLKPTPAEANQKILPRKNLQYSYTGSFFQNEVHHDQGEEFDNSLLHILEQLGGMLHSRITRCQIIGDGK